MIQKSPIARGFSFNWLNLKQIMYDRTKNVSFLKSKQTCSGRHKNVSLNLYFLLSFTLIEMLQLVSDRTRSATKENDTKFLKQ